jgi:aspartate ammonia-lyase
MSEDAGFRIEHDLLGELPIPAGVYYGINTARALENFPISGTTIGTYSELVEALAAVKQAAALANRELGVLDDEKADAIIRACEEIRSGRLHDQFVVDPIQGGAGISTNMNANEVIANRSLELMGHARGDYAWIHPLDHVNRSQSTNDVYPTSTRAALHVVTGRLLEALKSLERALAAKAMEFAGLVKLGRTELQDAVPMTLGQEFGSYAAMVRADSRRLRETRGRLREINLGGTAIGTGLNAAPGYAPLVCRHLAEITGVDFVPAPDLIEATQDVGAFVELSGVLKECAIRLSKICDDLRLLASGPRAGFEEITLPAVQAGSSIMPGKVNPSIPEVVNQIAFEVIGHDVTVTMAAAAGQLELNAFEPIIVRALFESLTHLAAGAQVLADRCVAGITAHPDHLRQLVASSIEVVTALSPQIGYAAATRLAQRAIATGRDVRDLAAEEHLLDPATLDALLTPDHLAGSETAPAQEDPSH